MAINLPLHIPFSVSDDARSCVRKPAVLEDYATDLFAIDFLTAPTATFRVLFVLVILSHDRREILHTNVTESPTAEWTARQNAYAERETELLRTIEDLNKIVALDRRSRGSKKIASQEFWHKTRQKKNTA